MTDYAHLDYPDNLPFKNELKRLLEIFNNNQIHYWADFSTLCKLTDKKDDKFLYYINSYEFGIFDEHRLIVEELLRVNNFATWNITPLKIDILTPDTFFLNVLDISSTSEYPQKERSLIWINIWIYKDFPDNLIALNLKNDFYLKKDLFTETEILNYCGLQIKIPVKYRDIYNARYGDKKGIVYCHAPKKRENCEKEFGFCNIGDYK